MASKLRFLSLFKSPEAIRKLLPVQNLFPVCGQVESYSCIWRTFANQNKKGIFFFTRKNHGHTTSKQILQLLLYSFFFQLNL